MEMLNPDIHDQDNLYSTTGSSSFRFNSFLGLLTSDDDDDDHDHDHYETDQDAFIEIALEPLQVPLPQSLPQAKDREDKPFDDREEDVQLRISFSSRVVPCPGFSLLPSALGSSAVRGYATTGGTSCPDDQAIYPGNSFMEGTPKNKFRAALNRLLRLLPFTLNISTTPLRSWELVGSREEVNMSTSSAGRKGVVGNFLVKLRATTFQMMMGSLVKLRQYTSSPRPERMSRGDIHQLNPRKRQMLVVKPFRKLFQRGMSSINIQRSKVVVFDVRKGREEAESSNKGREKKLTKSCPASVKSSPTKEDRFSNELGGGGGGSSRSQKIHVARDNSVQAAIAHCKKSLGGTEDFHF